jgi:predicted SprT family Zn-dependent metalloprotease
MISDYQLQRLARDTCKGFGITEYSKLRTVKWSNRLTASGGNCSRHRTKIDEYYVINISSKWAGANDEQLLMQILVHELVHLRYFNHSDAFKFTVGLFGNRPYAHLYGYKHTPRDTDSYTCKIGLRALDINKCYDILDERVTAYKRARVKIAAVR